MTNDRMVEKLREQWLEPEEEKIAFTCEWCGDDIQEGADYYEMQGECVCEECFEEFASDCRKVAGEE